MDKPQKSQRQIKPRPPLPKNISPQARPLEKRSPEFMRWIEAESPDEVNSVSHHLDTPLAAKTGQLLSGRLVCLPG